MRPQRPHDVGDQGAGDRLELWRFGRGEGRLAAALLGLRGLAGDPGVVGGELIAVVALELVLGHPGEDVLQGVGLDQGVGGVPPGPPGAAPVVEGVALRVGEPLRERHLGQPLRVVDRDVQAGRVVREVIPLAARFLIAGEAEQVAAGASLLSDLPESVGEFVLQLVITLGIAVLPLIILPEEGHGLIIVEPEAVHEDHGGPVEGVVPMTAR